VALGKARIFHGKITTDKDQLQADSAVENEEGPFQKLQSLLLAHWRCISTWRAKLKGSSFISASSATFQALCHVSLIQMMLRKSNACIRACRSRLATGH
jgi:hypothetical protein